MAPTASYFLGRPRNTDQRIESPGPRQCLIQEIRIVCSVERIVGFERGCAGFDQLHWKLTAADSTLLGSVIAGSYWDAMGSRADFSGVPLSL